MGGLFALRLELGNGNDDFLFTRSVKAGQPKTREKLRKETCYGNIDKLASLALYYEHDYTKNWLRKSFNP